VLAEWRPLLLPSRFEKAQQASPHALQIGLRSLSGAPWLELSWQADAARLAPLPLFVVGARTGKAATDAGLAPPRVIAASALELAQQIATALPAPARLLYLAGHDRKPDLETALGDQGHVLDVVVTYEARAIEALSPETAKALARGEADAVLHFSRRSAQLFAACAAKAGLATQAEALRHVCISRDAALIEGAVIAPTPDSAGLFKALEQM
jgi:uroporphyrinogen-III synthase